MDGCFQLLIFGPLICELCACLHVIIVSNYFM